MPALGLPLADRLCGWHIAGPASRLHLVLTLGAASGADTWHCTLHLEPCRLLLPGNSGLCASQTASAVGATGDGIGSACLSGSTGQPGAVRDQAGQQGQQQNPASTQIHNHPRSRCPTASLQLPACNADMLRQGQPAASPSRGQWAGRLASALGSLALLAAAGAALARRPWIARRLKRDSSLAEDMEGVQLLQLLPELARRVMLLKQQGRIVHGPASHPPAAGSGGSGGPRAHEIESLRQAIASGPLRLKVLNLRFLDGVGSDGADETTFVLLGAGVSSRVRPAAMSLCRACRGQCALRMLILCSNVQIPLAQVNFARQRLHRLHPLRRYTWPCSTTLFQWL